MYLINYVNVIVPLFRVFGQSGYVNFICVTLPNPRIYIT